MLNYGKLREEDVRWDVFSCGLDRHVRVIHIPTGQVVCGDVGRWGAEFRIKQNLLYLLNNKVEDYDRG